MVRHKSLRKKAIDDIVAACALGLLKGPISKCPYGCRHVIVNYRDIQLAGVVTTGHKYRISFMNAAVGHAGLRTEPCGTPRILPCVYTARLVMTVSVTIDVYAG